MKVKIWESTMGFATMAQSALSGAVLRRPVETAEFRRYERRAYPGRVRRVDSGNREMAALDLSAGGVGLLSSERPAVGQIVELAFLGGALRVKGVVSNVRPGRWRDWRVGVAFLQPEPELVEVARAEVGRALL